MEQPYWASIHDNLADGIQFVENHGGVTESTEGSPQRPAKKRRRFSRVLDTQIRIPVPHPPTSLARPSHPPPPPSPPAAAMDDSPSHPRPPPPPPAAAVDDSPSLLPPTPAAAVDDSQFESREFQISPLSHPTPAAPGSHPPSPQAIPLIQVILTTST